MGRRFSELVEDIRALTGRNHQGAINLLRTWKEQGKDPSEEIANLAAVINEQEDRDELRLK
jgi:hypothetical protein